MAIITNTEIKEYLKITGTSQDALLTKIASRAQEILEGYLSRKIEQATYTEKHDGGEPLILVKNRPIISVTSLKDNGVTVDASKYVVYNESGIVALKSGYFTSGLQKVEITYDAGYATVPELIKEAALEIAMLIYKDIDAGEGRFGKTGVSVPQTGNLNFIRQLNPATRLGLGKYKEVPV